MWCVSVYCYLCARSFAAQTQYLTPALLGSLPVASPTSTDIREVLLRICRELKNRFPKIDWDEVPLPYRTCWFPYAICLVPVRLSGCLQQEENDDYQGVKDGFFKVLDSAGNAFGELFCVTAFVCE